MNTELMDSRRLIVQAKEPLASDMNGEKVLMSMSSGSYYNLGRIGGRIWEIIGQPASIGQVVETLRGEYDIDEEACRVQVSTFLEQLRRESLVLFVEAEHD